MSLSENESNQNRDWFLLSIIVGIILLVIITLIVIALNPEQRDYRDDRSAENVAYNYLLAIQIEEYDKAYGYLSTNLVNYPADAGQFFDGLQNSWNCSSDSLQQSRFEVEEKDLFDDRAHVFIEETIYTNDRGLFSSNSYSQRHTIRLIEGGDGWRITNSDKCWDPAWSRQTQDE